MFRQLWTSFCHAFDGLKYCLRNERNFRVHIIAAITVIGLALLLDFVAWECFRFGHRSFFNLFQ